MTNRLRFNLTDSTVVGKVNSHIVDWRYKWVEEEMLIEILARKLQCSKGFRILLFHPSIKVET